MHAHSCLIRKQACAAVSPPYVFDTSLLWPISNCSRSIKVYQDLGTAQGSDVESVYHGLTAASLMRLHDSTPPGRMAEKMVSAPRTVSIRQKNRYQWQHVRCCDYARDRETYEFLNAVVGSARGTWEWPDDCCKINFATLYLGISPRAYLVDQRLRVH